MERGHFVAIAGPNGSGKSTLIKCICGILNVKEGSILIDNRPVGSYQPHLLARTVAYIPQNENGRVLNTVFDTVLTGRKPYIHWRPSDTDLNAVADILKLLNIESLSMRNINELSGGQQQIVFIARALAQNPKILLLDEPTANLDLRHQLKVMELLKKLAGDGLTILMSMHDVNMAIRYADYMMMLKDGQLLSYGTKDVITRENIENLYGVKVDFIHHNDRVHIIPCGLTVHQTD
jgi:iron complex transport system ATP-binding protein